MLTVTTIGVPGAGTGALRIVHIVGGTLGPLDGAPGRFGQVPQPLGTTSDLGKLPTSPGEGLGRLEHGRFGGALRNESYHLGPVQNVGVVGNTVVRLPYGNLLENLHYANSRLECFTLRVYRVASL